MIAAERMFETRKELALALAADVADALKRVIRDKGAAILAVSGGKTPNLFFQELSRADIPWAQVTVTLVDERQAPESSERSNARLVKTSLIQDKAAAARFVPLFNNPGASQLDRFDAVILGMGADGHTASFFPLGDGIAEALDPETPLRVIEINASGAAESRLTFTLPVLLASDFIALHIEGREKRAVLDAALGDGPIEDMPVRVLLRAEAPITLYWCP